MSVNNEKTFGASFGAYNPAQTENSLVALRGYYQQMSDANKPNTPSALASVATPKSISLSNSYKAFYD